MEYTVNRKDADKNEDELTHEEMMFAAEEIAKITTHLEIIRGFLKINNGEQEKLDDFANWIKIFVNGAYDFTTEPFSFKSKREFTKTSAIEAKYTFTLIDKGFNFETSLTRVSTTD